ncbi:MAG: helix-turn-helix transcriptional regulator [Steroidobacteraceae bacterium]|jgi:hypothetical protein
MNADELIDERAASALMNVAVRTLRNWRWRGAGPRYHKVGARTVRYRRADLDAFLAAGARAPKGADQ